MLVEQASKMNSASEQCLQSLVSKNCLLPHQFVCLQIVPRAAQCAQLQSCCFWPSCVLNTCDEMYHVHCGEVQMYSTYMQTVKQFRLQLVHMYEHRVLVSFGVS